MSLHDEIIAVIKLLDSPSKFTIETFARDINGDPVSPNDSKAVCWCLVGAIRKTIPNWKPGTEIYKFLTKVISSHGYQNMSVSQWSDKYGYETVMSALDYLLILNPK